MPDKGVGVRVPPPTLISMVPAEKARRAAVISRTPTYTRGCIILVGLACSPHPPRASPFSAYASGGFSTPAIADAVSTLNVADGAPPAAAVEDIARAVVDPAVRAPAHGVVTGGAHATAATGAVDRPHERHPGRHRDDCGHERQQIDGLSHGGLQWQTGLGVLCPRWAARL